MANVAYPRPAQEKMPSPIRFGLGSSIVTSVWVVASLAGLLGAFETLIVGEELSVLGANAHGCFGRLSDDAHYQGELLTGLVAFALSFLRLVVMAGLVRQRRWAYAMGAAIAVPCGLLDAACWSSTLSLAPLAVDALILAYCARRLAS